MCSVIEVIIICFYMLFKKIKNKGNGKGKRLLREMRSCI